MSSSKANPEKLEKSDYTGTKMPVADVSSTNKILSYLKKNWPLLLVIFYVLSPLDLLPLNPTDDTALIIIELIRQLIITRKQNQVK